MHVDDEDEVAHVDRVRHVEGRGRVPGGLGQVDFRHRVLLAVRDLLVVAVGAHAALLRAGVRREAREQRVVEVVAAIGVAVDALRAAEARGQRPVAVDARVREAHVAGVEGSEKVRHAGHVLYTACRANKAITAIAGRGF